MINRGHQCDLFKFSVLPITTDVAQNLVSQLEVYDVVHFIYGPGDDLTAVLQDELTARGVICPNRRNVITNLDDKIFQAIVLANNGVLIPKTVRLVNANKEEVRAELGFPFVLKDPYGMQGKGVHLCTEENFDSLVKKGEQYVGQELVKYTADYRIHVAGENAFCIYERVAPGDDFRANVSLGGAMKKVEGEEILSRLSGLALKTARALSLDYGGVDIIMDDKGEMMVLEFNKNPGFKNVTDVTGQPFYEPVADYYESLVSAA